MAFGVEVWSVTVANRDVVPKKELTKRLTPSSRSEQDAAVGNTHLVAGEADLEGRLLLGGVDDDDAVMWDKAKGDETGNASLPCNRNGVCDVMKLVGSERARGKSLAERILFEANCGSMVERGGNLESGVENESCGNADEKRE